MFSVVNLWSRSRSAHGDGPTPFGPTLSAKTKQTLQHSCFSIRHARLFGTRRSCFCTCWRSFSFFFFNLKKNKNLFVRHLFCVGGCSLFSMVAAVFWSVGFRCYSPRLVGLGAWMGGWADCWMRGSLHFLSSIKGCLRWSISACFIVMEGRHIVS